MKKIFGIF